MIEAIQILRKVLVPSKSGFKNFRNEMLPFVEDAIKVCKDAGEMDIVSTLIEALAIRPKINETGKAHCTPNNAHDNPKKRFIKKINEAVDQLLDKQWSTL